MWKEDEYFHLHGWISKSGSIQKPGFFSMLIDSVTHYQWYSVYKKISKNQDLSVSSDLRAIWEQTSFQSLLCLSSLTWEADYIGYPFANYSSFS